LRHLYQTGFELNNEIQATQSFFVICFFGSA